MIIHEKNRKARLEKVDLAFRELLFEVTKETIKKVFFSVKNSGKLFTNEEMNDMIDRVYKEYDNERNT